jgi:hypothetical protein
MFSCDVNAIAGHHRCCTEPRLYAKVLVARPVIIFVIDSCPSFIHSVEGLEKIRARP